MRRILPELRPGSLSGELGLALIAKLILLFLLWLAFFRDTPVPAPMAGGVSQALLGSAAGR